MEVLYGYGKIMGIYIYMDIYGDTRPGHLFQVANWKMAHENFVDGDLLGGSSRW